MATIKKRGDTYRITVSCGYDLAGKQIRRSMTYKPEPNMTARQIDKEVQRQAVLFEEKCQKGQVADGSIKFADFAEEWFRHKKNELRPKTYERYLSMLPRINAAIGHMRLDLLETVDITHKTAVRLLLFTGLRRGELLGLKWSDIDFEHCTMQVCRSSLYLPNRGIFEDETKNATSNRVIKLSQSAVNDLKKYKVWQMEQRLQMGDRWHETGYIFTNKEGKPLHPDNLTNWFGDFMRAHSDKLPYISLHSLRHTNATLQIASGIPLTTVAKRLGHANTVTTSRVYAHAIKSADEAAAEALENILTPTHNRRAG